MKAMVVVISLLWPLAALAQGAAPTVGDKPLLQVKPKAAAKNKGAPAKPQSLAGKLQACLDHDDGTKERLNCYDAVIKPQPKPKPATAKAVTECRLLKEEDERLACYNGFVEKLPKLPTR